MGRAAASIELSTEERRELEDLARRRRTAQGLAQRAQIVLLAAERRASRGNPRHGAKSERADRTVDGRVVKRSATGYLRVQPLMPSSPSRRDSAVAKVKR